MGARPRTLPVAATSVLAGTAIAATVDAISWFKVFLAFVTVVGVQVGANYANDYFDGIKGTDEARVGPVRLVATKLAPPKQVRLAAISALGVASVAGVTLALTSDSRLLILGAICLLAAWTYTGGPKPYAYIALGEFMVFLFFGPVAVLGIAYVQVGTLQGVVGVSLAAGIGVGVLTAAVMLTNNLRDIASDTASGKITLAGIIGRRHSRILYLMFLAVALLCLLVLAWNVSAWMLLGLSFLVCGIPAANKVLNGADGRELIPVLAGTGMAELLWGLGLFAGSLLA